MKLNSKMGEAAILPACARHGCEPSADPSLNALSVASDTGLRFVAPEA